jgi:type IV pilus biogenesis protein CpaD/CtpE
MTPIGRLTGLTILAAFAAGLAGCMHTEDPITQYSERTDKLTMSAGNSNDSNVAIQMIDPWPRVSANRQIPTDGSRMAGAYERYRDVTKLPPRPQITPPMVMGGSTGSGAGAGAGGGGGAR